MEQLMEVVYSLPLYVLIAAALIIAALVFLIIILFISKRRFRKSLEALAAEPDLKKMEILKHYRKEKLLKKSALLVDISKRKNVNLPEILDLGEDWVTRYGNSHNSKLLGWILEYIPDRGLFTVFQRALNHQKVAQKLEQFLDRSSDFLKLRRIALSGKGEPFDGAKALKLFKDRLDEIREMTGDPEWASRFFAIHILLHDDDERSARAVWESFEDPHSLIRSTVIREIPGDARPFGSDDTTEFSDTDQSSLYAVLFNLLLNDPVFEVRQEAKKRIMEDFATSYSLDLASMNNEQVLHVIQLLSPESPEDQDLALQILSGDDLELRQGAASYLQECAVLDRLFKESYMNDSEQLERNYSLLKNSLEVNVSGFLGGLQSNNNRGSLLLASRLLKTAGPQDSITHLADRVFTQDIEKKEDSELNELYTNTLECVRLRGNDTALVLLGREVLDIRNRVILLKDTLVALPPRGAYIFMPVLEEFLKDPDFPLKDELRTTLQTMPEAEVQTVAMEIIRKGRDSYSHAVRIQALKVLGAMKKESCLQIILENLPILPLEEAREFAGMLSSYAENLFNERVKSILESVDAQSRAAIIVSLPATGKKTFLKEIRAALDDANPVVRIASIWALVEYKEIKELARCTSMLRDPVPEVRKEVARALGTSGTQAVLKDMEAVLNDKNEVSAVIYGIIDGLGASESAASVDILGRKIANEDEYKMDCIRSLSRKKDKKSISAAIELFKDAGPQLREDLSTVFKMMGYEGEKTMVELLKEDIPSLQKYIAEVLESTGFVENHIRKLKHRDSAVRQESAAFLAAIRTKAAFRGIVLAARDPNPDVRIEVTKALEVLNTDEGKEILKALEEDPDKSVRKYTFWALERVRTKSLV
ncbi:MULTISPECIES: HEAT repeat domain-containing protein [unclassified Oceanispirochaeta]|uniref:HEAT repeat domain-containing protein n=1 Tax=unclassified Oceanispirochaeta TaxID=2635722 RepID=UPI000E09C17B|nr:MULTISPECIES: HEAT repeat domain-containing protein [unclassified Oceanispirochaeta]MBF9015207.1 HEAT repeat domain-containing protein [Oceanispirochaeta sp. M2]NPD71665.1 HEAT repeat domain-containing protein [Oceanispirochaeta sp. M1]RDG32862.1 transposase [Oceanispirochaeta sp. M1]